MIWRVDGEDADEVRWGEGEENCGMKILIYFLLDTDSDGDAMGELN